MSRYLLIPLFAGLFMILPSTARAQFIESRTLNLESAKQILEGAEAEAREMGLNVAISIVDPSGGQILFARMDGTGRLPLTIALEKARTAANFGRPTKMVADMVAAGNLAFLALDVMPLEGGIPVLVDGQVVGAVGVSGATAQQDAQIAQAGIDAFLR